MALHLLNELCVIASPFWAYTAPPPCQKAAVAHYSTFNCTTPCSITAHGHSLPPSPQAHKLHMQSRPPWCLMVACTHVLTHRFCVCGPTVGERALRDVEVGSRAINCTAMMLLPHSRCQPPVHLHPNAPHHGQVYIFLILYQTFSAFSASPYPSPPYPPPGRFSPVL